MGKYGLEIRWRDIIEIFIHKQHMLISFAQDDLENQTKNETSSHLHRPPLDKHNQQEEQDMHTEEERTLTFVKEQGKH